MDALQKKIIQLESNVHALEELLAVSEASFLKESKKLEEVNEMLVRENTYRAFFDASPEAMLTLYCNRFIDCNESAVQILRAKNKAEILNTHPWELSPEYQPDGRLSSEKAEEMISTALKQGAYSFEWYHKRTNGEVFPVEVSLTSITVEGKQMFNSSWRELTEEKRAKKELNEYHQHLEKLVEAKTREISIELEKHKQLENDIEQILDASSDAIRVIDKDYNIIYTSKSFSKLYGHTEDIVGKKCYDVIPEKECFTNDCSLKRILKDGKKFSMEKLLTTTDGTENLYNIDVIPYNDSNGDFLGIIKNYRDITEERKAEKRLAEETREREALAEKYRILFETSGDAIMLHDEKEFFDCNTAALKLLGYSKKQFLKLGPADVAPPNQPDGKDSAHAAREHIERALQKGTERFEWNCMRRNGGIFPVEVVLSRMEYKDNVVILAIVRDISERKQAEEKIRHISTVQKLIMENSTLGIALVRNRVFEWVNPRVGELLLLPVEKIQGASTRVIYPSEESYEELGESAYKMLAKGRRSDNTLQLKRSDGSLFWCRFIGKALDPKKIHEGSIWMLEDITEEKEAQRIAEENAQQQGRIEMANNMLHDIGNAITGISTYVLKTQMEKIWQEIKSLYQLRDLFIKDKNEFAKVLGKEKQHALNDFMQALIAAFESRQAKSLEFSEKISSAVGHVCSVLDLQRHYLRENALPLATRINLPNIINDTLVMLSGSLQKRNIKVSLDVRDKNINISGDQTRLIRVFLNIIKNTCEAFDETGAVEDGRKLEITMVLTKAKEEVKMLFSDNGIGFTTETSEKIFERGFTSKAKGSGIGLHECRSIIESHGGTISMKSKGTNTGVLTIITFPILK